MDKESTRNAGFEVGDQVIRVANSASNLNNRFGKVGQKYTVIESSSIGIKLDGLPNKGFADPIFFRRSESDSEWE